MNWTLRPICEADLPFLAALYASTRQEEMAQVPWSRAEVDAFLLHQFQLQHHHYQTHYADAHFDVVEMDGVPVGRVYVARWEKEIRLMDIALLPGFKGIGLGRALMQPLLEESWSSQRPIVLHVEHNNPVLGWYRRLGFVEVEDVGVYFRMERPPLPLNAEVTHG